MKQRNYKTSTKQDTTLYGIDSQDEMKVTQAHMASYFVKSVNAHGLGPSDTQTFRDQFANLSKASAPAPDWVKNFDTSHAVTLDTIEQQNDLIPTNIAEASHKPRRRIRGKTRPNAIFDPHTIPNAEHVSPATASGGSSLPRAGIG